MYVLVHMFIGCLVPLTPYASVQKIIFILSTIHTRYVLLMHLLIGLSNLSYLHPEMMKS